MVDYALSAGCQAEPDGASFHGQAETENAVDLETSGQKKPVIRHLYRRAPQEIIVAG